MTYRQVLLQSRALRARFVPDFLGFKELSECIVEGTVRAIVERTDGIHLQVDYGNDETALLELWRVHRK